MGYGRPFVVIGATIIVAICRFISSGDTDTDTKDYFNELVRLLERNGFEIIREKGSIRYYAKPGVDKLIRGVVCNVQPARRTSRPSKSI